jgi:TatD DNase family protein
LSKKRAYGIPPTPELLSAQAGAGFGSGAQQGIMGKLADVGVIFDMHTHLDMVVRYVANVAEEVREKSNIRVAEGKQPLDEVHVPTIRELVEQSAQAGIRGFLHCACELDDICNISEVLTDMVTDSVREQSCGRLNTSESDVQVFGAVAIHPNETVLHALGAGASALGASTTDLPRAPGSAGATAQAGAATATRSTAPDGLPPPALEERHRQYSLARAIEKVVEVIESDSRIRVVGETGLDYFRTAEPGIPIQQQAFREHISIAKQYGLPLQIHDRDAHQDVVNILKRDQPPETVLFHSFSGDVDLAQICIEHGWYTSFSGPITYPANDSLRAALQLIWNSAPELLLIETDAPFLPPVPYRGRPNTPAMIPHTLEYMSNFLNVDLLHLCARIAQNEAAALLIT